MKFEITTIRGKKKTVETDGIYQFGDKIGQSWSEEQWHWWRKSMEADLLNVANAEEYVDAQKYLYQEYQKGLANENNFFWNTVAIFRIVKKRPNIAPDYISRNREGNISSEYWYSKEGVIRGSKHWGTGVASCDWAMKGIGKGLEITNTTKLYGKAAWSEFVQKSQKVMVDGEFLGRTDFENTVGREKVRINGVLYMYMGGLSWQRYDFF